MAVTDIKLIYSGHLLSSTVFVYLTSRWIVAYSVRFTSVYKNYLVFYMYVFHLREQKNEVIEITIPYLLYGFICKHFYQFKNMRPEIGNLQPQMFAT